MGQKVNPKAFRLGQLYTWESRWFMERDEDYRETVLTDIKLRQTLMEKLKTAGIAKVEIERQIKKIDIILHVAKPGIVIGRGGQGMEELKKFILNFLKLSLKDKDKGFKVNIRIEPIKEPDLNAYLIATWVADQLAKRLPHKRVVNQALERIMLAGAKGARIRLSGRIAGAEISRAEKYQRGNLSLGTLREKIDYAEVPSLTKSGYIGVKVWICK